MATLSSIALSQTTPAIARAAEEDQQLWIVVERSTVFRPSSSDNGTRFDRIAVGPNETKDEALQRAAQLHGVLRVAIEQQFIQLGTPNDPLFGNQWNMTAIGMESAWDVSTGAGVVVAIIDSGLGTGGLDTPCNGIVFPYNSITQTEGMAAIVDESGHGTHVAGTIAQCTDNDEGLAGVAYGASIMPIKALGGPLGSGSTIDIARGIDWAVAHGADVINMSLGDPDDCGGTFNAIISPRLQAAVDQGITITVSAGNGAATTDSCLRYPASDLLTLAIGASTYASTVASYSDRGLGLTLVAPGGSLAGKKIQQESVVVDPPYGYSYQDWWGTSMASPHVAGVAALLKSLQPSLTQSEIESILTATATDIGQRGWDESSGAGIVNAAKAVANLTATKLPATIAGGIAAVSESQEAALLAAYPLVITRLAGANRYETAAVISRASYPAGADRVFVVTGENFADALGVGPIAYLSDAPILLTGRSSLPDATRSEIERLSPTEIVIVGGTAVISQDVVDSLSALASTARISGSNRYVTAAVLSESYFSVATTVYVVHGETFPDGLAGGPLAAKDGAPILLTQTDVLPSETSDEISRLGATRVVVIGGTAAVSQAVFAALEAIVPVVERVAGANRFETASALAARFPHPLGVTIVSGLSFPDALSVGYHAAFNGSPILLIGAGDIPASTLFAIGSIVK